MRVGVKAIAEHGLPPRVTPKNFLVAWLLVVLCRSDLHGYEILKELRDEFGITCEHGALYRTLRRLEGDGFIRSHWSADDQHAARRVYALTPAGRVALDAWGEALGNYRASLEQFFHIYHRVTAQ
jgi:PadR family transcriptional regulator, regulatory protein PadR